MIYVLFSSLYICRIRGRECATRTPDNTNCSTATITRTTPRATRGTGPNVLFMNMYRLNGPALILAGVNVPSINGSLYNSLIPCGGVSLTASASVCKSREALYFIFR